MRFYLRLILLISVTVLLLTMTACTEASTQHSAGKSPTVIIHTTSTKAISHPTGTENFSEQHPNWDNSEGFQPVRVKNPFGTGWALKVTAPIKGNYTQSETKSYQFGDGGLLSGLQINPNGKTADLTGYKLIIQAEFNPSSIPADGQPNWARPYAADWNFNNYYGSTATIDTSNVGHVVTLTAILGSCHGDGPTYNPDKSVLVGLHVFGAANNGVLMTYYILSVQLVYVGKQPCH